MIELYSIGLIKNIYKKPNINSEVTSQIIYGERFKVIKKNKHWLKIKTKSDNYTGFIKNNKSVKNMNITHKCYSLKTKIYNKNKSLKKYLPFNSRISINKIKNGYGQFEKGKWVKLKEVKENDFIEKNFLITVNKFIKTKYLWGGKTYSGIDCSALIQMIYLFNNSFFPRDTKDQIKFNKKKLKKNFYKKGNIIYWKGHVAICISNKKLIHAYGPKKKVLVMNIKDTIKIIEKTANLKIKKISKI